jgi:hypothetical protein
VPGADIGRVGWKVGASNGQAVEGGTSFHFITDGAKSLRDLSSDLWNG